jgi:hypothetical protein
LREVPIGRAFERHRGSRAEAKLAGTKWSAPGGSTFTFDADGTVICSANNEVASWTALDNRFVIRKTTSAWIDMLVFNDDLSDYSLHPKDFVNDRNLSFKGARN